MRVPCQRSIKKRRTNRVRPITHGRWYSSSRSAFGNHDQQPILASAWGRTAAPWGRSVAHWGRNAGAWGRISGPWGRNGAAWASSAETWGRDRSEEHTSELQSLRHLVCRLLL